MGVYKTLLTRWTNATVPYACVDEWTTKRITEFNVSVGKVLFVARDREINYVEFQPGTYHGTEIGMMGGMQVLAYAKTYYSLFHEMGHCLGLGHEYFHHGWPHRRSLLAKKGFDINRMAFEASSGGYTSFGTFDPLSIMSYSPKILGIEDAGPYSEPQALSEGDKALIRHLYP